MLRDFLGSYSPTAGRDDRAQLAAVLASEAHVVELDGLTCAYTGPRARLEPGVPLCLVDGTVYEALGLALPAREGPELEVALAKAYRVHGEELLGRLRGEFALLVYDPESRSGLLARDHMGGRGAIWHQSGGRLTFASEYRPLIAALPRRPDPDEAGLAHWLAISGMPCDRTLYSGVRRVEAGSALRLDEGPVRPFRYWNPAYEPGPRLDREDHALALREALERAVRRRVAGDARAGVLVSGGLDSGSVAALMARTRGDDRPVAAYSAIFPRHPAADESELIAELAAKLGLESTMIRVESGSVLNGALSYLRRFEVPPVSPNLFFWIPLLQRVSDDGLTALLDGEGGDELFGHASMLLADRLRRGRLLEARNLVGRIPGVHGVPSRRVLRLYLRDALKGALPHGLHGPARRARGPEAYAPAWLKRETAAHFIDNDDSHDWKRIPGPRWFGFQVSRVTRGMGPALAYDHIRRRGALARLEPRHPLVDVDVVELVLRTPPELSFDPDRSRPLLREALRGVLPDAVRLRATKSNFDTVFHESLAGADLPAIRALLGRPGAEVGAYVDRAAIADLIAAPPEGRGAMMWWALHVWRLVTAECWLIGQQDPNALERLLPEPLREAQVELSPAG
ncbi:MAG: asparagine synthetase B family protein [Thermoleophilaceae bacterium]